MAEEHVNSARGDKFVDTNDGAKSVIVEDTATTMTTDSSSFSIAKEESSYTNSKGAIGCATLDPAPSCSEYHSTRIQSMMENWAKFGSTLESEFEESKAHWSELRPKDDGGESNDEGCSENDKERTLRRVEERNKRTVEEQNLELYKSLRERSQYEFGQAIEERAKGFFRDFNDKFHKLGEKIGEGAQAEIFTLKFLDPKHSHVSDQNVLKVFKPGSKLKALQKQWPEGMLLKAKDPEKPFFGIEHCSRILSGLMLKDGRFAFQMVRCWGDLRKVIDLRMLFNGNQAAPFTDVTAFKIMFHIACGMRELHKNNILHRDLKASNVLIWPHVWKINDATQRIDDIVRHGFNPVKDDIFLPIIADFECSVGVAGTGFWRAPEILLGVKNMKASASLFSEKSDVYSYAMTCYEILTGKVPLENLMHRNYDAIFQGTRPKLLSGLVSLIGKLLERCWHQEPSMRPSFYQIVEGFNCYGYN